ncbi:trans-aconitate 2-methyltransferase [Arthrobacter crystallopoietes BAB-32]|uniref:Trans-aconitate 2-methyltransferase n=1 Tax=Arthrobacter crystallopoietes BAB-32 TaxID=1246476 RepID=N1V722_9MICC|nr:trans-aconitate 2-methyltransferase [Arthrobacter crystallopoietes]EMY35902.1 trans-aconitate 2-methyltransferase [Arthrobacter crystallopoietes BAB-32]
MFTWDPSKYTEYANERSRPFFDLTARILHPGPQLVVDLGCGTGELTASLAQRWPAAQVTGLDSSAEMVRTATSSNGLPNLGFRHGDIADWTPPAGLDVLVSNAALQWVPSHRELLRDWARRLRPGAWIAFQVPGNFGSPSHALMREVAESGRWKQQLEGVLRHDGAVGEPAQYLELLQEQGYDAEAWETTYLHLLQGEDPVLEWVRGTGLRPVLAALGPADAAEFEAAYAAELRTAYPAGPFGTVYPFRRIFCAARKR